MNIEQMKPMWTIEEALDLIRPMQGLALYENFNLGLAGGVLDRGDSYKDLDIICLPRSRKTANRESFIEEMKSVLLSKGIFDIKVDSFDDGAGWSGEILDGRIIWKMEFQVPTSVKGISTYKRIDWIFVDYSI